MMTAMATATLESETLAEALDHLGGIHPNRIRFRPAPGTATEADVVAIHNREDRLYELVDGMLVEKTMGLRESYLASVLIALLWNFVTPRRLGIVTGEAGMMRLFAGLVRIPDVAFISWGRLPQRRIPTAPIPEVVPDLVVEVLSVGNTAGEMSRKRQEYFHAGVTIVWQIDLQQRTVEVFTAPEQSAVLCVEQTLDGGAVLPGFALSLQTFFAALELQGPD